jgi:hypothetical protein
MLVALKRFTISNLVGRDSPSPSSEEHSDELRWGGGRGVGPIPPTG